MKTDIRLQMGHRLCRMGRLLAVLVLLGTASRTQAAEWPDTPLSRVEALALVQTLNANLLTHPSATVSLEEWCRDHHLADEPRIVAHLTERSEKPPTPEQRAELRVGPEEPVRYRHVELICGQRILSVADNWYVPGRLTADMNHVLETTDVPFGKAVAALHFSRRTLSARVVWEVLPPGWEMRGLPVAGKGELKPPDQIVRHEAVLSREDGMPFSIVAENYTAAMLDFPLLAPRPQEH